MKIEGNESGEEQTPAASIQKSINVLPKNTVTRALNYPLVTRAIHNARVFLP